MLCRGTSPYWELLGLADDGEKAAARAGLNSLVAEILALKGQIYVRVGNGSEAIAVIHRAVEIAKETNDPITEFMTLTQLGGQLAKQDLAESMVVRYAAQDLFERRVSVANVQPAQRELLLRQHSSLLVLIGLGEFDSGDFEAAIGWLERGVEDMRARHMVQGWRPDLQEDLGLVVPHQGQQVDVFRRFAYAHRVLDSLDGRLDLPHLEQNVR